MNRDMRPAIAMLIFLAVTLSPALSSAASSQRTDELLWQCEGRDGAAGQLQCISYIDGMMDMQALAKEFVSAALFCLPPKGISVDQAVRVFMKWAGDNPEQLHGSARVSVVLALASAFPCK